MAATHGRLTGRLAGEIVDRQAKAVALARFAEELGLDGFVVPAAATAVSAFGTGNSDLGFTAEAPTYVRVRPGATPNEEQLQKITAAIASPVALKMTSRNFAMSTPAALPTRPIAM